MTRARTVAWILVLLALTAGCRAAPPASHAEASVPVLRVPREPDGLPLAKNPVADGTLPHDTGAFTQGLLFHQGKLYESTGRLGESTVRRLDPETGEVELSVALDPQLFGEGLAYLQDRFYQLTWRAGVCLVYTPDLKLEKRLFYGTEGWGLTASPEEQELVFTDGTDVIRFLDPANLITLRQLRVTDGKGEPVRFLNELEWVNGEIWANIWTSDVIARIDPDTGRVKGWIKLEEIVAEHLLNQETVLNGIAYDPEGDRLWLTGKLWPVIYRFDGVKQRFFTPPDRPRTDTPDPAR